MDERDFEGIGSHQVTITNRELVSIKGVLQVDSFDDEEIVLDTEYGTLILKGEDLKIKQLDVQGGNFNVEGLVSSIQYSAGSRIRSKTSKSWLERIFR
ncbi:MAG TPA: sporulation protein YabP [Firmicutes bacterium]|nr:sporulation protein YabP [Bacillota bacterium]